MLHHGGEPGRWGSLGLWEEHTPDYAAACRALALRLGTAAGLRPGDRVLGIACGAGEELALWRDRCGARETIGIDADAGACVRARAAGLDARHEDFRHPPDGPFDRVLCVDAAYHLSPRAAFLTTAHSALREGGGLAFTDLVLDGPATPVIRAAARLCGIDPRCLQDEEGALLRLREAGFGGARCERLDDAVLGGFAGFAGRQARALGLRRLRPAWLGAAITAGLIPPARARGLGYALFSGFALPRSALACSRDWV